MIEEIGVNEEDKRTVVNVRIANKKEKFGFAWGDLQASSVLRKGDLVIVHVIKIAKIKTGWFRRAGVPICIVRALLNPTVNLLQGWEIREDVSSHFGSVGQ